MKRTFACVDCGHPTSRYRCKRCQCRETHQFTHRKDTTMNTINPTMGDLGEEQEEVELEPLEIPQPAPVEQPVPA